jgi:hypothetical protein
MRKESLPEERTAQVRLKSRNTIVNLPGATFPDPFFVTPSEARMLVDQGVADVVGGPAERAVAGPAETKPARANEKKSSDAGQDGRLTDSVRSSASASAEQPSASQAARASRPSNVPRSPSGASGAKPDSQSE